MKKYELIAADGPTEFTELLNSYAARGYEPLFYAPVPHGGGSYFYSAVVAKEENDGERD